MERRPEVPELLDLAERIVGWADEGEQVEAVVVHERETEVRAYEGEVESLISAESQGVGVRVVRDGRQGFAYAGTLDSDALAEVLAEARDNLTFATPDEHCALAEPDGVKPAELDLHRATLVDHPTEAKVALALDLERRTRAADPRISGVESARLLGLHLGECRGHHDWDPGDRPRNRMLPVVLCVSRTGW